MTYKIMVVDDDPITRMDLREMLKDEGYQVVKECKNGEEAVQQCLALKPDLIIMDVKMPILNGIKAAKVIRKKLDTAILLLTAYSQRELIEDAKESGVTAYLVKPVTELDLIPAIEIAMSQKQQFECLSRDLQFLKKKLEERQLIEKAKGKIMESRVMTEEQSYQWMRKYSMKNRIALVTVAKFILQQPGAIGDVFLVRE
ncbi:putative transcriptional regulatory protein pdtaR [Neobacillus rhizosphaerae]|uniref:Transcriptional regulatory protein pdtaR n=1 Tax=Neobacillus rhizosphaerae TaxID=2880965 RepID=A0ABN8KWJ9_9BACI|nr:response regulator [Neobacillus rhizosphaerae]CAH2717019.1 putative transcriptional regulatory protein pdtaR [Neobacillus rhizosphaerae]